VSIALAVSTAAACAADRPDAGKSSAPVIVANSGSTMILANHAKNHMCSRICTRSEVGRDNKYPCVAWKTECVWNLGGGIRG
jgi:hypothetical protein